jgi:hypothetical protein
MGNCFGGDSSSSSGNSSNKENNKRNDNDNDGDAEYDVKLILLGSGESGKSTFFSKFFFILPLKTLLTMCFCYCYH